MVRLPKIPRERRATGIRGIAQTGSAPGLGPGDRWFKSNYPDHSPATETAAHRGFRCTHGPKGCDQDKGSDLDAAGCFGGNDLKPEDYICEWIKDPADRAGARRDLEALLNDAVLTGKVFGFLVPKKRKVFASFDDKNLKYVLEKNVTQDDLDSHRVYEVEISDFDAWNREREFKK